MPRPPKWDQRETMLLLRRLRNACFREGLNTSAHLVEALIKAIAWERMEQAMESQDLAGALRFGKAAPAEPDEAGADEPDAAWSPGTK